MENTKNSEKVFTHSMLCVKCVANEGWMAAPTGQRTSKTSARDQIMDTYTETRASLVDEKSLGYELVHQLEEKRSQSDGAESTATAKKKSTSKAIAINLRVKKSDLALLDVIAEHFGVTRSYLLESFVSDDIETMFNKLYGCDQYTLARAVDKEIDNQGYENEYRGRTWYWDVLENLGYEGLIYLDHPDSPNVLPWSGL